MMITCLRAVQCCMRRNYSMKWGDVWSEEISQELVQRFKNLHIHGKERDGMMHAQLAEGAHSICFRGRTPLDAVQDLQEGLEVLQKQGMVAPEDESLAQKVDSIRQFVMKYVDE